MYKKNICVIGSGYWGKNHIKTLYNLGALYGVLDNNSDSLKKISKQYNDIKIYQSLDVALKDNNIMGFTICTPAETHYKLAKKIIESKKHILVEKPFTLKIEDAEDLVNLSEKNSINLMVGHVLLFHPAIIKIKELIKNGKIGSLQYLYSNRLNLGQIRTKENVFWSLAPHDIAIFQYFTDSYPESIKSNGSAFLQKGIADSTITQLRYSNGIEGHIFVSWLHPFKEHRLVVIGSDAMITFDDTDKSKPLKLYEKNYKMKDGIPEKIDGPVEFIEYKYKKPLTEELKVFIDSIESKKESISNGKHALDVTKILVEASRSLKINRKS